MNAGVRQRHFQSTKFLAIPQQTHTHTKTSKLRKHHHRNPAMYTTNKYAVGSANARNILMVEYFKTLSTLVNL